MAQSQNRSDLPPEEGGDANGLSLISSGPDSTLTESSQDNVRGRGGGPKTPIGKANSSRNATTYAITSPSPVAGGEPQNEYDAFYDGIREYWDPVGAYEEELVSDLSTLMWRLRRVTKAEVAYIDTRYRAIDDPDPIVELPGHRSREDLYFEDTYCDLGAAVELLDSLPQMDDDAEIDIDSLIHLDTVITWVFGLRKKSYAEVKLEFEEKVVRRKAMMSYLYALSRRSTDRYGGSSTFSEIRQSKSLPSVSPRLGWSGCGANSASSKQYYLVPTSWRQTPSMKPTSGGVSRRSPPSSR